MRSERSRALESVTDAEGRVHAGSGYTGLVLGSGWPVLSIDGLVSGFHPPGASHLKVLESLFGAAHLRRAYAAAARIGLRAHELGDAHLLWQERQGSALRGLTRRRKPSPPLRG